MHVHVDPKVIVPIDCRQRDLAISLHMEMSQQTLDPERHLDPSPRTDYLLRKTEYLAVRAPSELILSAHSTRTSN